MIQPEQIMVLVTKLIFGAFATFAAILLWSRTRDPGWMFIILGTLIQYAEIMVSTFELFGILSASRVVLYGVPVVGVLLANLPLIFYGIGFIIAVRHSRFN